jgi:nitrite reductase (NADH) small subunit
MSAEINLGPLDSIPPGEGRAFEVRGQKIAVFHTRSGQVFAVQAVCPHRGGPLADGLLGGNALICPLHSRKYDIATGAPIQAECPLKSYSVRLNPDRMILLGSESAPVPSGASKL